MSLRLRLALFVGALLVVLLGALGLFLGSSLGAWSTEALDAELEHHAEVIGAHLEIERDGELELEGDDDRAEDPSHYRVLDARGRVLLEHRVDRLRLPPELPRGATDFESPADGRRFRAHTRELHPEHEERLAPELRPLVVTVLAPAQRFAGVARRFGLGLGVALVLGLVLGGLGATVVAELVTRPVRRLSAEVAAIDPSALDRRVSAAGLDPDLARLAAALNGTLDRLERAFAEQRALVARASHALRTPVASILSVAEVSARRDRPAEEHRAALGEIAALAGSASTLVTQLLALSRMDAAGALQREAVDLDALAVDLERAFASRASEAGLALDLDVAPGLVVDADRAKLRELLEVLLDNALRYTPRGGAIGLVARDDAARVTLEVVDTGLGIAPEEREHVFERFHRGRAAEETGAPGSGLGLAIVKAIADAHGAELTLEPRPGGGTIARTCWPRATP